MRNEIKFYMTIEWILLQSQQDITTNERE
jgi:hypothetical protein